MYELNNIRTDGCSKYLRKGGGGGLLSGKGEDGKYGTCGHVSCLYLRSSDAGRLVIAETIDVERNEEKARKVLKTLCDVAW